MGSEADPKTFKRSRNAIHGDVFVSVCVEKGVFHDFCYACHFVVLRLLDIYGERGSCTLNEFCDIN